MLLHDHDTSQVSSYLVTARALRKSHEYAWKHAKFHNDHNTDSNSDWTSKPDQKPGNAKVAYLWWGGQRIDISTFTPENFRLKLSVETHEERNAPTLAHSYIFGDIIISRDLRAPWFWAYLQLQFTQCLKWGLEAP